MAIVGACVSPDSKGRGGNIYVGAFHGQALMDAGFGLFVGGEDWWRGFVSDTPGYSTDLGGGMTYSGNLRSRVEAWVEAAECGQIDPSNYGRGRYNLDGVFIGTLDSEIINFTPEQLAYAQQIAGGINAGVSKERESQS